MSGEDNDRISGLPAGNYRVTIEGGRLRRAPTREPMIEYLFLIMDGYRQGQRGRSQQLVTPETYSRVMENLNVCSINCPAGDIAGYLPRARGVELGITISDRAPAQALIFNRRLDNRSLSERGISEEVEALIDFGAVVGDSPMIEIRGVEDWECGDSLLLELAPTYKTIEGEQ